MSSRFTENSRKYRSRWDDGIKLISNSDRVWVGFIWLRTVSVISSCEHGNKTLVPQRSKNFLTCWATIPRKMITGLSEILN